MDQTAPLNGTTIKDQAWKEKKGVGPWIMVAVLLLGLAAFYAGQMSGSGSSPGTYGGGADASMMSFMESMESTTTGCHGCDYDNYCCCFTSIFAHAAYCSDCDSCINN